VELGYIYILVKEARLAARHMLIQKIFCPDPSCIVHIIAKIGINSGNSIRNRKVTEYKRQGNVSINFVVRRRNNSRIKLGREEA
jgi:hypothetical protein